MLCFMFCVKRGQGGDEAAKSAHRTDQKDFSQFLDSLHSLWSPAGRARPFPQPIAGLRLHLVPSCDLHLFAFASSWQRVAVALIDRP